MSTPEEPSGEPVSPAAAKKVVEYVRGEYFVRLPENDPLVAAVVRDPDAGLRALLAAKNKNASEQRIGKQVQHIAGMLRALASVATESPEAATDRLIGNVETGFAAFGRDLDARAEASGRMPAGSWLRPHMDAPGKIIEINQGNPLRNHKRFVASTSASRSNLPDPYFFYYRAAERQDFIAGFSPMERVMELSPTIDPTNKLDMLVVGHETKHSQLDAQKRMNMRSQEDYDRYAAFHTGTRGERPRIDLTEELFAFAWEIESANLLVDDRLRTGAILHAKALLRELGGRPDQEELCDMILRLARVYFPEGMREGQPFPQAFTHAVGAQYAQLYDVYVMDPTTLRVRPWR